MRQKELQCVVTFKTTTEAIAFEGTAKKVGLSGRLIPLPKAISAGCGLAWREDPLGRALLEELLSEHYPGYYSIHELVI